jgi:hypothetical protein
MEKITMKKMNVIAAGAVISLLLSGCGAKTDAQGSKDSMSTNAESSQQAEQTTKPNQDKQGQEQPRASMNPQQMQMMVTFRSLITMDKTDGLTITKEQAAQMLPVVQDSLTKNELTTDSQSKLVEKLTAEQKKFLDDQAANMQKRNSNNGGSNTSGSPKPSPSADQQKNMDETGKQGDASGKSDPNAPTSGNQQRSGGGSGGGNNIGQQLVELLESKTK